MRPAENDPSTIRACFGLFHATIAALTCHDGTNPADVGYLFHRNLDSHARLRSIDYPSIDCICKPSLAACEWRQRIAEGADYKRCYAQAESASHGEAFQGTRNAFQDARDTKVATVEVAFSSSRSSVPGQFEKILLELESLKSRQTLMRENQRHGFNTAVLQPSSDSSESLIREIPWLAIVFAQPSNRAFQEPKGAVCSTFGNLPSRRNDFRDQ